MEYIGITIACAILLCFGYVFFRRVIKGESADLKKRGDDGKILD